jgi:hypothetical protein
MKLMFVVLGFFYLCILSWGAIGQLPNVPTIGVLGMLWCSLGWSVVHRLEL